MKIQDSFNYEYVDFNISLSELDNGILSLTAMLNKNGKGKVYFGVNKDGTIVGLEESTTQETIREIGLRIVKQVKPVIVPKIYYEAHGEHIVISIEAEGYNKPYSAAGEYRIRVGDENKPIDPSLLSEIVLSNSSTQMEELEAIDQSPTFNQLKGLCAIYGVQINEGTFLQNLNLLTKKGTYNSLADILSDKNNTSIKVIRFKGKDKMEMVSRNEFGYRCLFLSMKVAYDYVTAFNEVRVIVGGEARRKEFPLFDLVAFEEAWTNACLHNRWVKNVPPVIYIYEDRIEVVSTGGLPNGVSRDDFFGGVSKPVNVGLQKIMGQLGLFKQTEHGVLRIIGAYGSKAFEITENHITVTIPFAFTPSYIQILYNGLTKSQKKVLESIKNNPTITTLQLCQVVNLGKTRVTQIIKELKDMKRIERVGGNRSGYWIVK